eukprot:6310822-Pyramimonas_sp.AAC.1
MGSRHETPGSIALLGGCDQISGHAKFPHAHTKTDHLTLSPKRCGQLPGPDTVVQTDKPCSRD